MSTTTVEVRELPTRLTEMIALAATGAEVIVTENHTPRAKLLPLSPSQMRIPGLHAGAISTAKDFDAPLPEDFWVGSS